MFEGDCEGVSCGVGRGGCEWVEQCGVKFGGGSYEVCNTISFIS